MAKASRSRKNKSTRKVHKGSRKMRGGVTTNKNLIAEKEEAIKLRQFLMEAIEEEDIDTLKIFIEQPQYRAILQEGLTCLENKTKLLEK